MRFALSKQKKSSSTSGTAARQKDNFLPLATVADAMPVASGAVCALLSYNCERHAQITGEAEEPREKNQASEKKCGCAGAVEGVPRISSGWGARAHNARDFPRPRARVHWSALPPPPERRVAHSTFSHRTYPSARYHHHLFLAPSRASLGYALFRAISFAARKVRTSARPSVSLVVFTLLSGRAGLAFILLFYNFPSTSLPLPSAFPISRTILSFSLLLWVATVMIPFLHSWKLL